MMRGIPGKVKPLAIPVASRRSATGTRHLLGIKDLSPNEFQCLVRSASHYKTLYSFQPSLSTQRPRDALQGRTIAMLFNKLSTRTRVSTEVAVNLFGGHPMFLGRNDIQLGVRETSLSYRSSEKKKQRGTSGPAGRLTSLVRRVGKRKCQGHGQGPVRDGRLYICPRS